MRISTLYKTFNILIGCLVLYYSTRFFLNSNSESIVVPIDDVNFYYIFISFAAYFLAHIVRAIRLFIIVGIRAPSIRSLIYTQLMTNGVNLLLPFKLGEVYRIVEFSRLFKNSSTTIYSIVLERFLDLVFLLLVLLILIKSFGASPEVESGLSIIFYISFSLLILALIFIYIIPNNINELRLFIAKNSSKERGIRWLKRLKYVDLSINKTFYGVKNNSSTILLLTLVIWALEVCSFMFFVSVLDDYAAIVMLAVLVFLSSLLPSGPLGYGGIQLAFYYISVMYEKVDFIIYASVYQIFIFGPAIVLALVFYMRKTVSSYGDR